MSLLDDFLSEEFGDGEEATSSSLSQQQEESFGAVRKQPEPETIEPEVTAQPEPEPFKEAEVGSDLDSFLNEQFPDEKEIGTEEEPVDKDADDLAITQGFKTAGRSAAFAKEAALGDMEGAAEIVAKQEEYEKKHPGSKEAQELMEAWQSEEGIKTSIGNVVGEMMKDYSDAPTAWEGLKATGKNIHAMVSGIVKQTPYMIAPMTGMVVGGAAGTLTGTPVGTAAGAWAGASMGNTIVEGMFMAMDDMRKEGIDLQDRDAVENYLDENSERLFKQAAVKGMTIGAVDVATMGITGKVLNAPARAASRRALTTMGVDQADKKAVELAMRSKEFGALIASDTAFQASKIGMGNALRNTVAGALEPTGEAAGEYFGTGFAKGEWNAKDAALEALSSMGQSTMTFAGQKAYQHATTPKGIKEDGTPMGPASKAVEAEEVDYYESIADTVQPGATAEVGVEAYQRLQELKKKEKPTLGERIEIRNLSQKFEGVSPTDIVKGEIPTGRGQAPIYAGGTRKAPSGPVGKIAQSLKKGEGAPLVAEQEAIAQENALILQDENNQRILSQALNKLSEHRRRPDEYELDLSQEEWTLVEMDRFARGEEPLYPQFEAERQQKRLTEKQAELAKEKRNKIISVYNEQQGSRLDADYLDSNLETIEANVKAGTESRLTKKQKLALDFMREEEGYAVTKEKKPLTPKQEAQLVLKTAEAQAREEIEADPIYAQVQDIRDRGGLNRAALEADYDPDTVKELIKKLPPGTISEKGTVQPDDFSSEMGYDRVDDMVQALVGSTGKLQAIEQRKSEREARQDAIGESIEQSFDKAGIEEYKDEVMDVEDLQEGDQIVLVGTDNVHSLFEHKGFDENGEAILESDITTLVVPAGEQVEIVGKKLKERKDVRSDKKETREEEKGSKEGRKPVSRQDDKESGKKKERGAGRAVEELDDDVPFSVKKEKEKKDTYTKANIQKAFPGARVYQTKPGFIVVMPNGVQLRIHKDKTIWINKASAEKAYNRKITAKTAAGSWMQVTDVEGIISLASTSGRFTLAHEVFHAVESMVLTPEEIASLEKKYGNAENRANAYADWNEAYQEALFTKIRNFVKSVLKAFGIETTPTPTGDLFTDIATGEVWTRKVNKGQPGETQYHFKDLKPKDRKAVQDFIDSRPDSERINEDFFRLQGTNWERLTTKSILARIAIEDLIAGRKPSVKSTIDGTSLEEILREHGEEGVWSYFNENPFVGSGNTKAGYNVNSSYFNCSPSKECATHCYATKNNYNYKNPVNKGELVSWAVEKDPRRAARQAAREYKATPEYQAGKALRLMDKGDLSPQWIPFIKKLNQLGVRVQIFSKRPELLRQISDMNVRMLSIDGSNMELAAANPDLEIAFVHESIDNVDFLKEYEDDIRVILPLEAKGAKGQRKELIKHIPKSLQRKVCPAGRGSMYLGKKWRCTKCSDIGEGAGCYFNLSEKQLGKVTGDLSTQDVQEPAKELMAIIKKEFKGEKQRQLLSELGVLVHEIQSGPDPGSETSKPSEVESSNKEARRKVEYKEQYSIEEKGISQKTLDRYIPEGDTIDKETAFSPLRGRGTGFNPLEKGKDGKYEDTEKAKYKAGLEESIRLSVGKDATKPEGGYQSWFPSKLNTQYARIVSSFRTAYGRIVGSVQFYGSTNNSVPNAFVHAGKQNHLYLNVSDQLPPSSLFAQGLVTYTFLKQPKAYEYLYNNIITDNIDSLEEIELRDALSEAPWLRKTDGRGNVLPVDDEIVHKVMIEQYVADLLNKPHFVDRLRESGLNISATTSRHINDTNENLGKEVRNYNSERYFFDPIKAREAVAKVLVRISGAEFKPGVDFVNVGGNVEQYSIEDTMNGVRDRVARIENKFWDSNSLISRIYTYIADRLKPVENLQKILGKQSERNDYLLVERLRGKVTANEVERFKEERILPLIQFLSDNNLTIEDMEDYAYARHAKEANAYLKLANARRHLDELKGLFTAKQWSSIEAQIFEIQNEISDETTITRKQKRAAYLRLLEETFGNIDNMREELEADIEAFELRVFTDKEIEKGTPERLWRKLENRRTRLDILEIQKDAWDSKKNKLSGITDAEAQEIKDKWVNDSRYGAIHKAVKKLEAINNDRLDMLFEAGEFPQEEYDAMKNAYKHYMPLHREGKEDTKAPVGRLTGPIGKPVKLRAGSTDGVVNIFSHVVDNYQSAVVRKHKLDAAKTLYNMVLANPDPSKWSLTEEQKEPHMDDEGNIRMYKKYQEEHNEVFLKIDGTKYKLTVNEKDPMMMQFLDSIKNTDAPMGPVMQGLYKFNRFLAALNTSWNPEFVISNFVRDIQTAILHMEDTEAKGFQKKVIKRVPSMIKAIWNSEMGKDAGELGEIYKDFSKHGGKIGWMQGYESVEHLSKDLQNEFKKLQDGHAVRRGRDKLIKLMSSGNMAVENGIRLALYAELTGPNAPAGMTKKKAAKIVSDLTVDFTRRGKIGSQINALYMFLNAGIQGNVRMVKAMSRSKKVQKMVGGIFALGLTTHILGVLMGGDDDDGESYYEKLKKSKPGEFERNMIFMIPNSGGRYVKIPMPYLYNTFFIAGNEMGNAVWSQFTGKDYDVMAGSARTMKAFLNSANPLQAATLLQTLSPTITDPLVQVQENKAWHGGDLMPGRNPFGMIDKPDSERYFNSVNPVLRSTAQFINRVTGGDAVKPGLIDVSPETMEMMIETYTGGLGRFVKDSAMLPYRVATGDLETRQVPFARRVAGQIPETADSTIWRENVADVKMLKARYKAADGEEKAELRKDDKFKLFAYTTAVESRAKRIRKTIRALEAKDKSDPKIEELKEKLRGLYIKYNKRYNESIK